MREGFVIDSIEIETAEHRSQLVRFDGRDSWLHFPRPRDLEIRMEDPSDEAAEEDEDRP